MLRGDTVQHEVLVPRLVQRGLDYHERDLVGNELALLYVRAGELADLGLLAHMVTEDVPRRYVLQFVLFLYARGLRALAGTGCAQQDYVHIRPPLKLPTRGPFSGTACGQMILLYIV